jgi:Xaa-Pro aminopeptidase
MIRLALGWILAVSTCAAGIGEIPHSEYRARREALRKALDGVVVLFGQRETNDEIFRFQQEPNFLYLSGWVEPGAILLITPAKEALFLPHHDEHAERFLGNRTSAEDQNISATTGFEHVYSIERFEAELSAALNQFQKIYSLPAAAWNTKLAVFSPFREISDPSSALGKLRVRKSEAEIEAIQHATDVTLAGHRAAWKRMAAGLYEYQLGATLSNAYLEQGCEALAYSHIVGSGKNGTVLHYFGGQRRMDQGDLVVMDSAAQCNNYASDITRTVPVSGKFSPRQRELYQIVLGAQKAAIDAIKPGLRMGGEGETVTKIVKDYFNAHGKDLHGEPLGKYFTHGLGHPVGLQVHDPRLEEPLEAGMVVTVEPGLYIPEEGIGIRIEDVVLVTEKGAKVLSAALPRDPDEIEKALAK